MLDREGDESGYPTAGSAAFIVKTGSSVGANVGASACGRAWGRGGGEGVADGRCP